MIAIVGAALAPGIAILSYVYLRDHLQPEPISMVIRSYIFGLLLAFPIMILQYIMQNEWNLDSLWFRELVSAAFLEEFFKWLLVFHTAYRHVAFDEPYDGIVYAAAVSLGFATLENFLYLLGSGLDVALWRALFPVSGHALFGIWMGYYLGVGKFAEDARRKQRALAASLFGPVLLHALYNLILLSTQYWLWLIVPFMSVLWWRGLKKVELAHRHATKNRRTRPH